MVAPRVAGHESGQATLEWVGLVLLVALLVAALIASGLRPPGLSLAGELADRLLCGAGLSSCAHGESELLAAYGPELAAAAGAHAPRIEYEGGMRALPVDFRSCRADPCSMGAESGAVSGSASGEPVTLFTHVVDCRAPALAESRAAGYDCSGDRRGHLYLQYWAYYPGSQTSRMLLGQSGFHPDDWESYQVRVSPGLTAARASSHHGYNYTAGAGSLLSDAGLDSRPAWGLDLGRYFVSGGSHAGHASDDHGGPRWTPSSQVRLVPLEAIAAHGRRWRFEVTPPWRKHVYLDPEYEGTD